MIDETNNPLFHQPVPETNIKANLEAVRDHISRACQRYHREADEIMLLAVSKTKPVSMVKEALDCGQQHFGENYLQDATTKIRAVVDPNVVWHFIGAIQSNKTRSIASSFDWVHTVSNQKVARRLNDQRPSTRAPLNVLLQVNIDDEETKTGLSVSAVKEIIEPLLSLKRIHLRGLMAIPKPSDQIEVQRNAFKRLRTLQQSISQEFDLPRFDQLSMGMTADLEAAVAEGTTLVRIGTAIFGARTQAAT